MAAPILKDYSDFEFVDTQDLGDGRHLGELHLDAPAEGFRYFKDVWFTAPFSAFGGGIGGSGTAIKTFTPEWTIQIRESSEPAARVLFEQTVKLPVQVIVQLLGGSIGFAFWSPLSNAISIETSIVNGLDVPLGPYPGSRDPGDPQDHRQGWQFVDTLTSAAPTEYAEQGLPDFDFSDTGTFTAFGVLIKIRYYSAPYLLTVNPGNWFDAVRDTAGIGRLDKEATYAVSFKTAPGIGHWLDSLEQTTFALPATVAGAGGVVIQQRTARRGNPLAPLRGRAFMPAVGTPSICKTGDGRFWLLCRDRGGVGLLYVSDDDGLTFERATVKSGGVESEAIMFGEGFDLLDVKPAPGGGDYLLALKDGLLYLQKWPAPFEQNRTVGAPHAGETYRLGVQAGRQSAGLIRVESGGHLYESDDEFSSPPIERTG